MANAHESVKRKVAAIFKKLAGSRADSLDGAIYPDAVQKSLALALAGGYRPAVANEIAFHLVDWNSDAAFLIALLLFPERFRQEEIEAGIIQFLVHVPHHVIAAARLGGHSTKDIFAKSESTQRTRAASKRPRRVARTGKPTTSASRRPRRT